MRGESWTNVNLGQITGSYEDDYRYKDSVGGEFHGQLNDC
jgi:hypothetical protein